jgi:PTH1 family peptidyl-tRNA hydrolase
MKLIVGLGNPGQEYETNRHNVGFLVLDQIQKDFSFPEFQFNKKFNALISEKSDDSFLGKIGLKNKNKIILIKPQTFMNRSGESVQSISQFFKISPENITVIHDDLDIIVGNHKSAWDSSARGHNGIQDIISKLGTQKFNRIKVGVEIKEGRLARKIPGKKFVLQNFSSDELDLVKKVAESISKTLFEQ